MSEKNSTESSGTHRLLPYGPENDPLVLSLRLKTKILITMLCACSAGMGMTGLITVIMLWHDGGLTRGTACWPLCAVIFAYVARIVYKLLIVSCEGAGAALERIGGLSELERLAEEEG